MRKFATLMISAVLVAGCGGSADEPTTAPAPQPTPAPAPPTPPVLPPAPAPEPVTQPYDFGDDEILDRWWVACAADNEQACDDLYWGAPLGSEYERFALERLDELAEPEITFDSDMILDLTWQQLTAQDRADFCDGANLLGADFAAMIVAEAADFAVPVEDIIPWIEETCR